MTEEVVLDDDDLLKDRLLRSLHRNRDGHLAIEARKHDTEETHNVAVIYVYTTESQSYMLYEHYVYSHDPRSYAEWLGIVHDEMETISSQGRADLFGVYGWLTNRIVISPLRTGDVLIKIDKEGARGVRLTFNSRENNRATHEETTTKARRNKRNRV